MRDWASGTQFDCIFVSPLSRAVETALILFQDMKVGRRGGREKREEGGGSEESERGEGKANFEYTS